MNMSIGDRGFVEFLIEKIKREGILSACSYSTDEIEQDVIDMIWEAYEEF